MPVGQTGGALAMAVPLLVVLGLLVAAGLGGDDEAPPTAAGSPMAGSEQLRVGRGPRSATISAR